MFVEAFNLSWFSFSRVFYFLKASQAEEVLLITKAPKLYPSADESQ